MITALDSQPHLLDPSEQKFVANVRDHGWAGTAVIAEPEHPGFSYTTGIWQGINQPELIIFGLPKTANAILWDFYRDFNAGRSLDTGVRLPSAFGNDVPAYAFAVAKEHYEEYLGWSLWFYDGDDFPCLQIVWPDRNMRFPWEAGFEPDFVGLQPDLTENGWANALTG